jgi:trimethylamine--corrinoid protein Co-methyltransferase
MRWTASPVSPEEQEHIHAVSLRILSEVGVRYLGQRAPGILQAHGVNVSDNDGVARLPRELIEQALRTAPSEVLLEARNPTLSYPLPSPSTHFGMDGTAAFTLDFTTGERRYGTTADIRDAMRVLQSLEMGVMAWAPTCASDAPAPSRPLHEFFTMLEFCSKHGEHELHRVEQVPYLVEGLRAIQGSEDAIRAHKICSLIYCPVAPLVHDGQMLDAYLELGQFDLPVMVMPMPVVGTTGPASLFANICLANAEALSAFVIYQLAHPGRPMVYANAIGVLDFSTGGFLAGGAETGLQAGALTGMGRFYNLPTTSTGCSADAKEPGAQAVLEKMTSMLPPFLAGADMVIGIGLVECSQALALEQMVVDEELGRVCRRLVQGVAIDEAHDLLADIAAVGPGGHFLKRRSTRQAPRSGEFYLSGLLDRRPHQAWSDAGRPSIYSQARARVREVLAGPLVDPMPEAVTAELHAILRRADQEIPEEG